ncbi:hypothetical protein [Algoriphagus resistens]|uniref:hypothetical protein n=1 Tax=Algoriphagus resistens TaxID=1750590 RepID=UPI000716C790|nr:hypothetical protein [Algoriphagus resistens]
MESKIKEEVFLKKGKMKKDLCYMTAAERVAWKEKMGKEIRSHLFSIGQPLVYRKNGQMIAEYADGHIEKV